MMSINDTVGGGVKYVPKVPWEMNRTMGKRIISTFGALWVMLGQEGTEGLGFSTDAVPPWIASAPFQEDKTWWYGRILDNRIT